MLKGKHFQILIIILLVIGLAFTSTAAIAYWNAVQENSNVVIEFGGDVANLQIVESEVNFTGKLVPEGRALFEGEFEVATFIYTVSIDKTLVKEVDLIVEAIDVKIDGSLIYGHLVDIQINGTKDKNQYDLFNSEITITVVVRLLEPIDADEVLEDPTLVANVDNAVDAYNAIKGKELGFTLKFSVVSKTV